MQDNNRFFQLVWRINALAIAGVAVLAGVLGLYAAYHILMEETRERQVTDLLTVNPQQPVEEEVRLGYPQTVSGTQIVRIPLYREQKTSVRYYSKSSGENAVNELFVDSNSGQSTWLFKGIDRLILNQRDVLRQLKSDQPAVTSLLYTLVEKDSNGDGRLSSDDFVSVGYSSPEGKIYTPLLGSIEKLFAVEQVADDRMMMVYSNNGESRMITYALPSFTVVVDTVLPKLDATP